MSDALAVTDPRHHALTVPGEKTEQAPSGREAPPAAGRPQTGTTWDPHDRVPQADAEAEC